MSKSRLILALFLCLSMTMQAGAAERVVVKADGSGIASGTFKGLTEVHGAAVYAEQNAESVKVLDNTEFINNSVNVEGAAIANYGRSLEIGNNVSFKDNTAFLGDYPEPKTGDCQLGTLYSEGTTERKNIVTIGDNVTFENNKAEKGAGIFLFGQHEATIGDNAKFISNKAQKALDDATSTKGGGAISLVNRWTEDGKTYKENGHIDLTIGKDAEFTDNSARYGGAIDVNSSDIKLTIGDGATFKENKANGSYGGAIHNAGTTVIGKESSFTGNESTVSGGAILNGNEMTIGEGAEFEGNNAVYGGAISNYKNLTIKDGVAFKSNTAEKNIGGAIYNCGTAVIEGSASTFEGNKGLAGGAIANDGTMTTGGTFTGNNADNQGGAVYNRGSLTISANSVFESNQSGTEGGAIYTTKDLTIKNAVFTDNYITDLTNKDETLGHGGAIYNAEGATLEVGGSFTGNKALHGGAIYNKGSLKVLDGSLFEDNFANIEGSAIASYGEKVEIGNDVTFKNNTSFLSGHAEVTRGASEMGALYSEGTKDNKKEVIIGNKVKFEGNKAYGGAGLYIFGQNDVTIGDGAKFISNKAQTSATDETAISDGGAIKLINRWHDGTNYNNNGEIKLTIGKNAEFRDNSANWGGAISVNKSEDGITLKIDDSAKFIKNEAKGSFGLGGAIYNGGTTEIGKAANFTENKATNGGAIYNVGEMTASGTFEDNNAVENGGAIYTKKALELTDAIFTNNKAGDKGGAIYSNADLTINAENKDVLFSGNTAKEGSDIYMNAAGSTLNLNVAEGKTITFDGGISGTKGYKVVISSIEAPAAVSSVSSVNGISGLNRVAGSGTSSEAVVINSVIENGAITVNKGSSLHLAEGSELKETTVDMKAGTTLNTQDNRATEFKGITLADGVKLVVDIDIANGKADNFGDSSNTVGEITISDINLMGNVIGDNASENLLSLMGIDTAEVTIAGDLSTEGKTKLDAIRTRNIKVSGTGKISSVNIGNSYKDFNPAVMAAPVAAQVGGYLNQINSYGQAFRNMDMNMLMTKEEKQTAALNKYYASEKNMVYEVLPEYDSAAIWVRPYSIFEDVELKDGPKVTNTAYGAYFGADSKAYEIGEYKAIFSIYAGYNGSKQEYESMDISQNGGTLGIAGMAYKGNFFAGLTLNGGISSAEIKAGSEYNTYGYSKDDITMIMAGAAAKAGYNIELADSGKYVLQPSLLVSYSMISAEEYTTSAGFKMKSNMLNAIQAEPGLKFISDLGNGWKPYAGVSAVCSLLDETDFTAAEDKLPELSVDTYMKYGIGTGKVINKNCSGFIQAYFTTNGRSGADIQAGFKYAFGK